MNASMTDLKRSRFLFSVSLCSITNCLARVDDDDDAVNDDDDLEQGMFFLLAITTLF